MLSGLQNQYKPQDSSTTNTTNTHSNTTKASSRTNDDMLRYLKQVEFLDIAKKFGEGYDRLTLYGMIYNRKYHKNDKKNDKKNKSIGMKLPPLNIGLCEASSNSSTNESNSNPNPTTTSTTPLTAMTITVNSTMNEIHDAFVESVAADFMHLYDENVALSVGGTSTETVDIDIDVESILMIYVTPLSISINNIVGDFNIWYNHPQNLSLILRAILKEASTGLMPYIIGFFMTIFCFFILKYINIS